MADERDKDDDRPPRRDDSNDEDFIPDADAGETDAASVSRDQSEKGHEEYKTP